MVTNTFKREAFKSETGEVFLVLLTITDVDIPETVRVVNNTKDIVSNGNNFVGFEFDLPLPDSPEGLPSGTQLRIDNVSREIAQLIRAMVSSPTVTIEVILASDPDTIERSYPPFNLRNVEWDMFSVTGDLVTENMETEPCPAGEFTPGYFPGLFRG